MHKQLVLSERTTQRERERERERLREESCFSVQTRNISISSLLPASCFAVFLSMHSGIQTPCIGITGDDTDPVIGQQWVLMMSIVH